MTFLGGLGVVLSLVFGCLLLALVAELYYLIWWKKQMITTNNNRLDDDYSNHTKEMFYLFCWDKPSTSSTIITANPAVNHTTNPDLELGLGSNKDVLLKALSEESVDSELIRMHNLACPPRFLFTIKEETNEDLESDDGKTKTRSLGDLISALESQTPPFQSPVLSPQVKGSPISLGHGNCNYSNPLFESSMEAELFKLRCSPPPRFKFLRDAEEKLYRKLLDKAKKGGVLSQEVVSGESHRSDHGLAEEKKDSSLVKANDVHCSSQVLPLDSSPSDQKKQPLQH